MRWRYGDTNPVMLPVDSATAIEIGDLLYLATDDVRPASQQADQSTLALNQDMFHGNFAGVAMQSSPAGETGSIRVATTGVFEFDCAAATFEVGDTIGPDENAGGTALEDQAVIAASGESEAIGRCARRANPAATRVLVDVVSTVTRGGPQQAA
jgi:predicted RecA/RadA family phage recombinase